ncbi:MAG TPA: hypothetical protein VN455_02315, partial [Methanotrichaceae archaeon]|nr:hypothetical protein [Methanotrichaceae archaeon]
MLLAPGACGFSYSVTEDGAGCCATFSVPAEESIASSIVLDAGSISNTINGKGDLHENHFIQNGAGASALVRASVMNASSYTYSYELDPDPAA